MNTCAKLIILALSVAMCAAQMPGIGWCPDKRAMPGFDIDRYMGTWYEAERYFTVLEAGSRCARTNYTKATDGRILVSNELINRVTGVKRALDGEIRNIPKGGVDSKITVKYSTLPFPLETTYIILDTDYDTYSVVWSCSGYGPFVNTQSAWVMTRDRLPPGTTLQKAYDVLDKNKISRTFFVRADQEDCELGEAVPSGQNTPQTYHHQYRTAINAAAASTHPKLSVGSGEAAEPAAAAEVVASKLTSEPAPSVSNTVVEDSVAAAASPAVSPAAAAAAADTTIEVPASVPAPEPIKLQIPQELEEKKQETVGVVHHHHHHHHQPAATVSTDVPSASIVGGAVSPSMVHDVIKPQPAITEPPKKSH